MAGSYQKHQSLRSFLRIRYFHEFQVDTELENFESAIKKNRTHLSRQLKALGVKMNLFKQCPKARAFYVTPEAANLFTYLLDIDGKEEYGRPFDPKKLSSNSVLFLRKQLLDALLSCRISRKDIVRTIRSYDKVTGFPEKCLRGQLEQYLRRQAKQYLCRHVKPKSKPATLLDITPEPIVTNPPSIDLSAYHLLIDTWEFNSYWQIDCADLPIFPPLK